MLNHIVQSTSFRYIHSSTEEALSHYHTVLKFSLYFVVYIPFWVSFRSLPNIIVDKMNVSVDEEVKFQFYTGELTGEKQFEIITVLKSRKLFCTNIGSSCPNNSTYLQSNGKCFEWNAESNSNSNHSPYAKIICDSPRQCWNDFNVKDWNLFTGICSMT